MVGTGVALVTNHILWGFGWWDACSFKDSNKRVVLNYKYQVSDKWVVRNCPINGVHLGFIINDMVWGGFFCKKYKPLCMIFVFMAWSWWIGVMYITLHMLWTNTEFCTIWLLLLFSTPKGQHTLGMGTWFAWPQCCHCCDYSTQTRPQYILCYNCELKSHHICVTLRFSLHTKWGQDFFSRNLLLYW